MSRWTEGLNPEQVNAVMHTRGPLLILAGAGSGKTTVLVSRTGRLLEEEKIRPDKLCVLTFTNKAARELRHRVEVKLGREFAEKIWAGTFHSFGLQWMRAHAKQLGLPSHFGVIDSSDSEGVVREILKETKIHSKDAFRIDKLLSLMSQWKEKAAVLGRAPERLGTNEADEYEVMAAAILPKYKRKLELLGVADFSDLLVRPLALLRENEKLKKEFSERFDFVMVDEFQDTNEAQLELVRDLSLGTGNVAVVGDDDQSIYGWRGARVSNILDFPKEFKGAKVIRLEQNYRSSPSILNLANSVIASNKERHGKTLRPRVGTESGELPELFSYETEEVEVAQTVMRIREFMEREVATDEIAVLYRSNGQGGLLEAELRREQIPYSITGGQAFFDRKEVKDVLAYLRSAVTPNEVAFRRILATPPRGIGETSIERLSAWAEKTGTRFHVLSRKWKAAPEAFTIPGKAGDGFDVLFEQLDGLPDRILKRGPGETGDSPGRRLLGFLEEIGYREHMRSMHKSPEAFEKRWMPIEVFSRVLDSFLVRVDSPPGDLKIKDLLAFLDAMELRDSVDDEDEKQPKVQLMTLHACKGLEFDAVCLLGCEEDLLPHRTLGGDISEERRLFYVGVTRARKHLVLSRAQTRRKMGRLALSAPSRFLLEIPEGLIRRYDDGVRPLAKAERTNRLGDMFAKLEAKSKALADAAAEAERNKT